MHHAHQGICHTHVSGFESQWVTRRSAGLGRRARTVCQRQLSPSSPRVRGMRDRSLSSRTLLQIGMFLWRKTLRWRRCSGPVRRRSAQVAAVGLAAVLTVTMAGHHSDSRLLRLLELSAVGLLTLVTRLVRFLSAHRALVHSSLPLVSSRSMWCVLIPICDTLRKIRTFGVSHRV